MIRTPGLTLRALGCALLLAAPPAPLAAQGARIPSDAAGRVLESAPVAQAATADSLVQLAQEQIGRRYLWGGSEPDRGFDCSGFTRYLMRALNVVLPRTAHEQSRMGEAVPRYVHASSAAGRVVESRLDHRESSLVRAWRGVQRVLSDRDSAGVAAGS